MWLLFTLHLLATNKVTMSSDFDRDEDEKELIPAEEAPRELEEVEYHAGGDRSRTGRKRKSSTPRDSTSLPPCQGPLGGCCHDWGTGPECVGLFC